MALTIEPLIELLSRSDMFGALDLQDRKTIAGLMNAMKYGAGALIFSRGDAANGLYMLSSGDVRLSVLTSSGRELTFFHATVGSIFGEIATLDGGLRTAEATALTAVSAFFLPQKSIDRLIDTNPRIARGVIDFLCKKLRETSLQVEDIALFPIEVRLARFILSAAKAASKEAKAKEVSIALGISQSEIALLIGASRPKVNAALAMLESEGALKRTGAIFICFIPALERIAESD